MKKIELFCNKVLWFIYTLFAVAVFLGKIYWQNILPGQWSRVIICVAAMIGYSIFLKVLGKIRHAMPGFLKHKSGKIITALFFTVMFLVVLKENYGIWHSGQLFTGSVQMRVFTVASYLQQFTNSNASLYLLGFPILASIGARYLRECTNRRAGLFLFLADLCVFGILCGNQNKVMIYLFLFFTLALVLYGPILYGEMLYGTEMVGDATAPKKSKRKKKRHKNGIHPIKGLISKVKKICLNKKSKVKEDSSKNDSKAAKVDSKENRAQRQKPKMEKDSRMRKEKRSEIRNKKEMDFDDLEKKLNANMDMTELEIKEEYLNHKLK